MCRTAWGRIPLLEVSGQTPVIICILIFMTKAARNTTIVLSFIGLLIALGIGFSVHANNKRTAAIKPFAQCLADSGATFYGAFWCPHCQNQKRLFGSAGKALPYVECSNPDRTQNQTCTDAGIESYPTWKFADGSQVMGEQSFAELAEKTGCTEPVVN